MKIFIKIKFYIHQLHPLLFLKNYKTKAIKWSQDIIESLNYVGVICIEFFVDKYDNLFVNEIAPRVHNSGHLTIESYNVSQFQSHLRAVCDLSPIGPQLKSKAQMLNLLGKISINIEIKRKLKKYIFSRLF